MQLFKTLSYITTITSLIFMGLFAIPVSADGNPESSQDIVAFQANNGYLYTFDTATGVTVNTLQGMASDTSPAVAALSSGGYEVAFQANNGYLYTYSSQSGASATTEGMTVSSNPAITALSNGTYEIAFSALGINDLYFDSSAAGPSATDQGIQTGTSPSITSVSTGFEAAFNANNLNMLYVYLSAPAGAKGIDGTGPRATQAALAHNTSPSINSVGDSWEAAYSVPGSNDLGLLNPGGSDAVVTNQGLTSGTSPSLSGLSINELDSGDNYLQVAFQAAGSNHLIVFEVTATNESPALGSGIDTDQGMAITTSPNL